MQAAQFVDVRVACAEWEDGGSAKPWTDAAILRGLARPTVPPPRQNEPKLPPESPSLLLPEARMGMGQGPIKSWRPQGPKHSAFTARPCSVPPLTPAAGPVPRPACLLWQLDSFPRDRTERSPGNETWDGFVTECSSTPCANSSACFAAFLSFRLRERQKLNATSHYPRHDSLASRINLSDRPSNLPSVSLR